MRFFIGSLFIILFLASFPAFAQQPPVQTDGSVIEGVFSQVSKLPPAKDNPYPDCYYTAVIQVAQIVSGASIPQKIVLVLPGFFSREYAAEAKYKVGDKVRATVVPFSSMPEKVRQTQQADEIEDVDLEFYYPKQIAPAAQYQTVTKPVPFAVKGKKAETETTPKPVDMRAKAARRETMQHDLKQINKLLAKHGGNWDKWYRSSARFREGYKKQYTAKAKLWKGDSFFSAGYKDDGKVYSPEFIKSVVALKNYLASRNVDLILVRVPNKGEIVDDLFAPLPPDGIANPYLLRMYKELLEADVEIVADIVPKAKENRLKYPLMYWYQDFPEIHPAEGMSWTIAEELASRVSRYSTINAAAKKKFNLKQETQSTNDYKWPEGNTKYKPADYVTFAAVTDDKGDPVALKQGTDSPLLVMGSSFIAFPSMKKGASIPHYLAYQTGVIPDILYRSGADPVMFRSITREGDDFLRNRSVCVFPFVPGTAYKSLTPLPIFDPEKSEKTPIASYTGVEMRNRIELGAGATEGAFTYTPEGTLVISPVHNHGANGSFKVTVPNEVARYPYFTMEVEFASKDLTNVTAKYAGHSDFSFRSDTQSGNIEKFAFSSSKAKIVDLDFQGNPNFRRPVAIKSITFFGVKHPRHFDAKE